mgnify:FL=1
MGNIVLLDDLTINKIAAGEVIERPASVIKEMIENSIDAGANNITVEIEKGGISYIKVTDNGKGISADDLDLAFERHATSKIRSADDLDTVTSMGFRGEALASIAAIARVELVSKTAEQQNGYKVVVEGGNILDKSEIGCPKGTSITVTNLFYNTPVRYKFLKKDFTEAGYIEDAITRVALVHPEVAFKLISSGRTVIQTNGNGDLKTVIYSIYGKDVANGIIDADYTYEDIHISGVVGKPEIARSNRAYQMFFVNKRFIKDKSLSSAAEKAYKGMLPLGKFSFLVLNIEMNPSKVDVNVHPAKLEVRFEEENIIFKAIYHTIKEALLKAELVANTEHTTSETRAESQLFNNPIVKNEIKKELIAPIKTTTSIQTIPTKETAIQATKPVMPPVKGETIVEQIFNARKIAEQQDNNITDFSETSKDEPKIEKTQVTILDNSMETSEIEKSQEVLKKLQEMKQKLIQETHGNVETPEIIKNEKIIENEKTELDVLVDENKTFPKSEMNEVQESEKLQEYQAPEIRYEAEEPVEIAKEPEVEYKIESEKIENPIEVPETKIETVKEEPKTESGYSKEFEEMYLKLFGTKPIKKQPEEEKIEENQMDDIATLGNTSVFDNIEEYQKPNYKFIGIVFNTYIIIEIDKEMYIIDQHAAHERILYEKVKANYYNDENKNSQLMLLPDIITLSHKEMEIAKDNMQMFRKAGFMIEEFGENTIKLTGVPEVCIDLETKEMFMETLDEIDSISRTAKQEIEEKFIATIACKAAVKANMALTKEEVDSLMNELLALPNPFTCPHGRPTAIKMTKYDIERKFARK